MYDDGYRQKALRRLDAFNAGKDTILNPVRFFEQLFDETGFSLPEAILREYLECEREHTRMMLLQVMAKYCFPAPKIEMSEQNIGQLESFLMSLKDDATTNYASAQHNDAVSLIQHKKDNEV